ncbi:MAG: hypothetical protein HY295_00215 [Thaumarchaeota archaeon]|nr:hypothetical protein [Nitrososphaerota archaeon]
MDSDKYSAGNQVTVEIGKDFISKDEVQRLKKKEMNLKWISRNYDALLSKHPEEYIAVKDEKIIATGTNYKSLISGLRDQYGINFCTIAVKYIEKKKNIMYPSV